MKKIRIPPLQMVIVKRDTGYRKADCRRNRRQSAFLYRNLIAYFALFARVRMHLAHNVFFTIFPFSITVTR